MCAGAQPDRRARAGAVAPRRVSANCDGAVVSGVAEERPFLLLQNLRTVSPAARAVFSNGRGCKDGRGEGRGSLLQFWAVFRDAQAGGVRSSLILLHKQTALTTNCSRWICIHSSIYSFIYFVQRRGGKKSKIRQNPTKQKASCFFPEGTGSCPIDLSFPLMFCHTGFAVSVVAVSHCCSWPGNQHVAGAAFCSPAWSG